MLTKRVLMRAAIAATWIIVASGAHAADDVVRIGWLRSPSDVSLGKARGVFEQTLAKKGIKVEWAGPFSAALPAYEGINAGSIDIALGSSTATVAALAAKIPLVIFAYQRMNPAWEGIVARPGAGISSPKNLVGKKVAVNRGGTGEYLLVKALETNGIDPKSVERVYLSPGDSGPSFVQGSVDAWATWDPFLTIAESSYKGKIVADGAAIGSDNQVVLVASREFADKKRDKLQAVFDALKDENAWSLQNKDEAGRIWVKEMSLPNDLAARIGATNANLTTPVSDTDIKQLEKVADWYVKNRIIPTLPEISSSVVKLK